MPIGKYMRGNRNRSCLLRREGEKIFWWGPRIFIKAHKKSISPNWRENKHEKFVACPVTILPQFNESISLLLFCFFCTTISNHMKQLNMSKFFFFFLRATNISYIYIYIILYIIIKENNIMSKKIINILYYIECYFINFS